ncbi:SOS response-associated peptidase family protein [Flavobacterium sp. W21_SRS_FM6]|uniref:SOS response-associated peptidase family protein n=1 Tax=Flavobacterium sp. W21_SRS_FM6 TaxID=3240268 RepID=UPI003F93818A
MCGYVELENGEKSIEGLKQLNFNDLLAEFSCEQTEIAYPAFGGDTQRKIPIIILEQGELKKVYATWWFDCFLEQRQLVTGKRTTFNARNLSSPYWQSALHHQRGIMLATGLGESKLVGKTKQQFYFSSKQAFCLGVLYQKFANGEYSAAIITRDAHPKFEPYHDKAFPLFLPLLPDFAKLWLQSTSTIDPRISALLAQPRLYPRLEVQRVKTFKAKVAIKSFISQTLLPDA